MYDKAWITEDRYIICLHDVPKEFEDLAKYLEGAAMDAASRRRLEAEKEEKMYVLFIIKNILKSRMHLEKTSTITNKTITEIKELLKSI